MITIPVEPGALKEPEAFMFKFSVAQSRLFWPLTEPVTKTLLESTTASAATPSNLPRPPSKVRELRSTRLES